ncbi:hypothetical protein AGABI1DRAFT_50473 [Agaricus bisporus var. burnettii JB137-S8]|uniref:Copper transport protein n=1 Tax=Agaricus bisporus var. burnettii (strain JB137-S8 / ATCC MYA-4627 / FGSC 10392) TaxID=597362 RepID=K5X695_AGABU|nr:uncharacterized protein AGABI1DRAFT_50473 [Agaricus bisporus var. burnettii JB137-S8]EKM83406.1 hypothetical protein AGABI1DRAFT_50473 [Agaricus bisporus var. burnettii JB137-S8]
MSDNSTYFVHDGLTMIPFFHFTAGDRLLFDAWQPTTGGAIAGACIGAFFFAVFERWVHAVSPAVIHYLVQRRSRSVIKPSRDHTSSPQPSYEGSDVSIKEKRHLPPRTSPPFIVGIDVPRGMIYAFQRLLGFILMLAIMTFQAGYILSIIAGLGLGEMLFGRAAYRVVKDNR